MSTSSASAPITLPKDNLRPPKTPFLIGFEEQIARLNDFYWGVRAGFHTLAVSASQGATTTDEFLPADIGKRWALDVKQVPARVADETERLRHVFVVQATTIYEDYLASILRDELTRVLVPTGGPLKAAVEDDLREDYVDSVAKRVVSGKYSERATKLHKVLAIDPAKTQPKLQVDSAALTVAGELRNCIVHTGGVIDDRAFAALSGKLTGVAKGSPLRIADADMFRLVGALKDHVEAVDLLVRLRR